MILTDQHTPAQTDNCIVEFGTRLKHQVLNLQTHQFANLEAGFDQEKHYSPIATRQGIRTLIHGTQQLANLVGAQDAGRNSTCFIEALYIAGGIAQSKISLPDKIIELAQGLQTTVDRRDRATFLMQRPTVVTHVLSPHLRGKTTITLYVAEPTRKTSNVR
jgi:hypothetical protein